MAFTNLTPAKRADGRRRAQLLLRGAFFLLFVLAPLLDLLRFDLTRGHAYFLGFPWTLGVDGYVAGTLGGWEVFFNLFVRGFLPLFGIGGLLIYVAWRYGRLYCGWLCPHFSVVEIINGLMRRTFGRLNLWEKTALPERDPDGRIIHPDKRWWPVTLAAIVIFGFVWATVLLTYLLPPSEIYGNLFRGALTRNQTVFITVGTLVFSLEFLLARHLFCRFGCAVGLFQSLAWMANRRAMEVDFDASRARACIDCENACENACPMRLKPRNLKRHMITCTQCAQCISACEETQQENPQGTLLQWSRSGELSEKSSRGGKERRTGLSVGQRNETGERS